MDLTSSKYHLLPPTSPSVTGPAAPPFPLSHQLRLLGLISRSPAISVFKDKCLDAISPMRKHAFSPYARAPETQLLGTNLSF